MRIFYHAGRSAVKLFSVWRGGSVDFSLRREI